MTLSFACTGSRMHSGQKGVKVHPHKVLGPLGYTGTHTHTRTHTHTWPRSDNMVTLPQDPKLRRLPQVSRGSSAWYRPVFDLTWHAAIVKKEFPPDTWLFVFFFGELVPFRLLGLLGGYL